MTDQQRWKLARALARQCRYVIQGCLREEEWRDADETFALIIFEGLTKLPYDQTDAAICSHR